LTHRHTISIPDQVHRFVIVRLGASGQTFSEYVRHLIMSSPEWAAYQKRISTTVVEKTASLDQPLFDIYGKPRDPMRQYTPEGYPLATPEEEAEILRDAP
jgi:hypothetical protein